MKFYNAFGITPINTYLSAGSDYYIPNIKDEKQKELAKIAFQKSYNKSEEDINNLENYIIIKYPALKHQTINIIHLFLGSYISYIYEECEKDFYSGFDLWMDDILIYDEDKDVVGVKLDLNDTLFINSGIKVALDTVCDNKTLKDLNIGICGLYVNKSGMGNKGFDVRAQLVDQDYSGFVHLSVAYTKDVAFNNKQSCIYCGDKLTQMMLIPIFHTQYEEVTEEEYNNIMSESNRGDSGFGSSDIKH